MFRTTHIRTKLALALAIPMVALVAVAGFEVVSAKSEVDDARSQADLAEASIGPGSLVVHLQNERDRASIDLIGLGTTAVALPVQDNAKARSLTDPAAVAFVADTNSRGAAVAEAYEPAWTAFEGLAALRADIDGYDGPRDSSNDLFADEVFHRYTDIIEAFFDGQGTLVVDDAALRSGIDIVGASTRQSELRARIWRQLAQATATDRLAAPFVRQEVAALFDRSQELDTVIRTNATGPYAGVADGVLAEVGIQSYNRQIETYLAGGAVDVTALLATVVTEPSTGYAGLRATTADLLSAEANRIQDDAVARERLFAGLALGGLLLALLVVSLASRSITRPLHSLKDQAEEMAGTRLPAAVRQILETPAGEDVVIPKVKPLKVKSKDEVSEVAAALSKVQASAVDLAVEQAVLRRNISDSYINLGRRNQNLLSRQLDFITELERNESDPDSLEGLFRLDHLATRMRRNAESLLVLAGIEPPRQWSAPVKMADVVRAALGEVEDYQRVVVRHLEPAAVTGAVATDVAHVLAELIENALSFSPPDQSVEVKGRLDTWGYTVAVTDNGLGMASEDVERANRRLAGKESFTVAPSRYLGHYVAGHLASRLGIVVELQDSPAGGITARVDIPMGLLADDELDRTLAKAPTPEPVPEPVVAGPTAAVVSTDTTPGGLARRGERARPAASGVDSLLDPPDGAGHPAPAGPIPVAEAPPAPATTPGVGDPVHPDVTAQPASAESAEPAVTTGPGPSPLAIRRPSVVPPSRFGGLAASRNDRSTPTAAKERRNGAAGPATEDDDATEPTAGGLARRVPGAQRPDASVFGRSAEPVADDPARTTPEDVYSFLSNFQSGVARGRADASDDTPTAQEDGR